ncbi:hypothetical protein LOK49_LG03G02914 [Camellia lanceoleosa]|uniref:Uncharacterized protein n=1 Tax=Camellia lanceoleosa TaxID=1840588 RepID=A0ACC0IDA2_9ERIC|nr:hypothetical protein LOK49_LG03G02914 [Camellia lanceoleosa]
MNGTCLSQNCNGDKCSSYNFRSSSRLITIKLTSAFCLSLSEKFWLGFLSLSLEWTVGVKASSDELLRKFAEMGSGSTAKKESFRSWQNAAAATTTGSGLRGNRFFLLWRHPPHPDVVCADSAAGDGDGDWEVTAQLVHPACQSMLGYIRSGTLDRFKDAFHKALNRGDEFSVAACDCTESFMSLFDEGCAGVRSAKRKQLEEKLLQLVHPAYQSMLGHIRSGTLDRFKDAFHKALNRGDEFSVAACDCTESFMSLFDEGCADELHVIIRTK